MATKLKILSLSLQVIELMGKENVKVKSDQMAEIISMLRKEALIEDEEKQKKEAEQSAAAGGDVSGESAGSSAAGDVKQEVEQKQ